MPIRADLRADMAHHRKTRSVRKDRERPLLAIGA